MDINYHLENIITESLFGKYTVHLCCYTISKNEYILYLLELINNNYYFPHFISNNNVVEEASDSLTRLNLHGIVKGYYLQNTNCYLLIQLNIHPTIDTISPYIFSSIYEILFMRSCLGQPVHHSVVQLFIHHPYLLYLYDKNRKAIPELGYYKTSKSELNFHSYIGLDPDENGNIILYNSEKVPQSPFVRVLSTVENYNVKNTSTIKSRTLIVNKYMIVSSHKN